MNTLNMTKAEVIARRYVYDPLTGKIYWRSIINADGRGCELQYHLRKGYGRCKLDGTMYSVHKLCWFLMTGAWPTKQLDHINGDRNDNRWDNLREVTASENMHNREYTGCHYKPDRDRWTSYISIDGKRRSLGTFRTAEEAQAAYIKAKEAAGLIYRIKELSKAPATPEPSKESSK